MGGVRVGGGQRASRQLTNVGREEQKSNSQGGACPHMVLERTECWAKTLFTQISNHSRRNGVQWGGGVQGLGCRTSMSLRDDG
jgi:hypothetical protein